jgi:hypothetical protein
VICRHRPEGVSRNLSPGRYRREFYFLRVDAALEDVAADEMDALNLSIGFFPQPRYEDDPLAQAVERLTAKTIVSKSAGNMGPDPGMSTARLRPRRSPWARLGTIGR